jgi:sortase A
VKQVARIAFVFAFALAAFGACQVASAGWIHAKAILAQHLIASAWKTARDGGPARRPWPWADMRPIARLAVPARHVELYVLDSATPRALAFGPAHVGGTATPGMPGNSVLVAHRDTHFSFLRELAPGEWIEVEGALGRKTRYRVTETTVVDQSDARVLEAGDETRLTLITCYPFDAVQPGTRQRYVVVAERAV